MTNDPVEAYLQHLTLLRNSTAGTNELTYYTPLLNLLNSVGGTLKPAVQAVTNLKNIGAGHPDVGLFVEKQSDGRLPERGVIEVKGMEADVSTTAVSEQVHTYLQAYQQVLVTNYWDFLLIHRTASGQIEQLERFRLAADEASFWAEAAHPRALAQRQGTQLVEYLKRVMLRPVAVSRPQDVAWFLASYARDALARIGSEMPPGLVAVRASLQEALGLTFQDEQGDRFFRSTLIQTLFYGVFSAWVLWHNENPVRQDKFEWRLSAYLLRVPVIQVLFEQLAVPSRLRELNLLDVLDWVGGVLNRVNRAEFFDHFAMGEAVQYFYEPFLEAFSPELRRELGVWYTPPEVVTYMVERVDHVLRTELGKPAGLADPDVVVLDPACGTGAYLVGVLERIERTLREEQGETILAPALLKQAATERLFGFEILPAPFVIAHLQMGLRLQNMGVPLAQGERAAVFLTNALTGWTPPEEPKQRVLLSELAAERDAAEQVKQQAKILVVLGNPPYYGYAGVAVDEERELSDAYRTTQKVAKPQGQGLNDLYVRFFRMAERAIVELEPQAGLVCFISNYSWLDGLSFTGMRERYLQVFDQIWLDRLNGDKYKTGKTTPDGKPDPSIFSTEWNKEGIQVGTAVALLLRQTGQSPSTVYFRDLWGTTKRAQLLTTAVQTDNSLYDVVQPVLELGLALIPGTTSKRYLAWPKLPDLFPVSFPGIKTSRDNALVEMDKTVLHERLKAYFDPAVSHEQMAQLSPQIMTNTNTFEAEKARMQLQKRGFLPQNIVRYAYRPFDVRWLYWEAEANLVDRRSPEYFPQVFSNNLFLFTTGRTRKANIEPALVTNLLLDLNCMDSGARGFPLYLHEGQTLFGNDHRANLSRQATEYLKTIAGTHKELFLHSFAILHSAAYRSEHTDAIRLDWPRVPLPTASDVLAHSAQLGERLAQLLNPDTAVAGITAGSIHPPLRPIAPLAQLTATTPSQFIVEAGWGYTTRNGTVTMPGGGTYQERDYTAEEMAAMCSGSGEWASTPEMVRQLWGETTYDVYLNGELFWQNIPANVWGYTLGGYQVIKKWLSYREQKVLGRGLTLDEVREVTNIARRIAAILWLQPALDSNYQVVKGDCYPWEA